MPENNFICFNCRKKISDAKLIGTHHRNHCPFCLWSKHVDLEKSGDRMANCGGSMGPIGLTFKQEGKNKYGKVKQGELMIVHECHKCGKISLNRIAGDDGEKEILELLEKPKKAELKDIDILSSKDKKEVKRQLFGK